MRGIIWKVGVALVAAPLVFAACRSDASSGRIENAGIVNRDSTRALGAGDIRIVSTDSAIEVALIGDSVVTGLAARALAKIRATTDTAAVTGTGLGAKLEKLIKSSVQTALNKEVTIPLASVSDVRFDRGMLELLDASGKRMALFGPNAADSSSHGGLFSAPDAQAFIAAFRTKKARIR